MSEAIVKEYLNYEEAAEFLGVSSGYVYVLISNGKLHPVRSQQIGMRRDHRKYLNIQQLEAYRRGETFGTQGKVMEPPPVHGAAALVTSLPPMPSGNLMIDSLKFRAYQELQQTIRSLGINAIEGHKDFMTAVEEADDVVQSAKSNGGTFVNELARRTGASEKEKEAYQSLWDEQERRHSPTSTTTVESPSNA
jgi:excisionase family DNA binding protein